MKRNQFRSWSQAPSSAATAEEEIPLAAVMLTNYAERYELRSASIGGYLLVNSADQQIERKALPDDAWIFHTHDGAVTHAGWIGKTTGKHPMERSSTVESSQAQDWLIHE